jgi:hypothetical protein
MRTAIRRASDTDGAAGIAFSSRTPGGRSRVPPPALSRLLKKAHLLRWRDRALAVAYLEYASLGPSLAALHLDLFEQPGRKQVFQQPANPKAKLVNRHDAMNAKVTKGRISAGTDSLDIQGTKTPRGQGKREAGGYCAMNGQLPCFFVPWCLCGVYFSGVALAHAGTQPPERSRFPDDHRQERNPRSRGHAHRQTGPQSCR